MQAFNLHFTVGDKQDCKCRKQQCHVIIRDIRHDGIFCHFHHLLSEKWYIFILSLILRNFNKSVSERIYCDLDNYSGNQSRIIYIVNKVLVFYKTIKKLADLVRFIALCVL